ncbi:MAG: hypothetical protein RIC55_14215 [Pirellulaceae bacterium]
MKISVQPPTLPKGTHRVRLDRIDSESDRQFGTRLLWRFVAPDGGEFIRRTGDNCKPGSALATLIEGMADRALSVNEEIDTDDYVGRDYMITLDEKQFEEGGDAKAVLSSIKPVDSKEVS